MTETVNTEQREVWNGWLGAHWTEHPDRYDGLLQGYNTPLLDACGAEPSSRVLDVGCGTGQLTRAAGARATRGAATGVDISARMITTARTRTPASTNVSFAVADVQVHGFTAEHYDCIVSRGGVMFFDDPLAALRNVRRALRAGGHLAFLAPGAPDPDNEYSVATAALRPHMRRPSPTTQRMMSMADPDAILALLSEAGFRDVRVERVETVALLGADPEDAAGFICGQGMVRSCLDELDAGTRATARVELIRDLAAFHGPTGVRVRDAGWLVSAVRG